MGLILKIKKSQQKKWHIFFSYAIEAFKESKLIGLPFGKSGYGFIGNPYDEDVLNFFKEEYSEDFSERMILLLKDTNGCSEILELNPNLVKNLNKLTPDDVIFEFDYKYENKSGEKSTFWQIQTHYRKLFEEKLNIMIPNHYIINAFFEYLISNNLPPIIIGFLPGRLRSNIYIEPELIIDYFNNNEVGVILGGGKLQKGKAIKRPSVLSVTPEGKFQIHFEGLVSEIKLKEKIDNLLISKG